MRSRYFIFLILILSVHSFVFSQSGINNFLTPSDTLNKPRRNAVIITEASVIGLSLIGLNQIWYADYDRSKFHTINDNSQWLQMDKLGHVYTAYQVGRIGADLLAWSGVREKDQLIYGGTLGFGYLAAVEVFDGFSEEWGFSWGDILANALGTGLYVGQELLWNEQRMTLKYSFHQTQYAPQRPDVLGEGLLEEMVKDYNGQTYWLSINLRSFLNTAKIPKWFNIAFGYGAEGLLTGSDEMLEGMFVEQDRRRQFYLSLDIDLTRINTESHVLRTLFSLFNSIKIPFPTVEFNDENGIKFHAIYF